MEMPPGRGARVGVAYILSTDELHQALAPCTGGYIGIDCEFLSAERLLPKLALVQLNIQGRIYLVLPERIDDWSPLIDAFQNTDICWVLHACSVDVIVFRHIIGTAPLVFFDTQIAAQFLGHPVLSYEKMVCTILGVPVQKDVKMTCSNWERRPLSDRQEQYAAGDVVHLIAVAERMVGALCQMGRYEWVREECAHAARLSLVRHSRYVDPDQMFEKFPAHTMTDRSLLVLRDLLQWREATCKRRNYARPVLAADKTLAKVARSVDYGAPKTEAELLAMCPDLTPVGRATQDVEESRAHEMLAILRDVEGAAEEVVASRVNYDLPCPIVTPLVPQLAPVLAALQKGIALLSKTLALQEQFLAPGKLLEELVASYGEAVHGKRDWLLPDALTAWRKEQMLPMLQPALEGLRPVFLECSSIRQPYAPRPAIRPKPQVQEGNGPQDRAPRPAGSPSHARKGGPRGGKFFDHGDPNVHGGRSVKGHGKKGGKPGGKKGGKGGKGRPRPDPGSHHTHDRPGGYASCEA